MVKVRIKQDEDTTYVDGMMGTLADDLSNLLGIAIYVLRTKDEFRPMNPRIMPQIKYYYQIVAETPEQRMAFGRTSNPNEIKRSLAMLTDMIHMGFIKSEPHEDTEGEVTC